MLACVFSFPSLPQRWRWPVFFFISLFALKVPLACVFLYFFLCFDGGIGLRFSLSLSLLWRWCWPVFFFISSFASTVALFCVFLYLLLCFDGGAFCRGWGSCLVNRPRLPLSPSAAPTDGYVGIRLVSSRVESVVNNDSFWRCTLCIGWFLKRFHLVFLESSWFPKKKKILLKKAKTKDYLWASFHHIWSLSKSSKLDIQKYISAKQIMIWKMFLCENKNYTVVVLVPNFHLSARSSSFFHAFFLHVYGEPF